MWFPGLPCYFFTSDIDYINGTIDDINSFFMKLSFVSIVFAEQKLLYHQGSEWSTIDDKFIFSNY